MSILEKAKYIKINYNDNNQIKKYINERYKIQFNWKYYLSYYKDLELNNFEDTWCHWIKHGIKEKRKFFVYNNKESTSKSIKNTLGKEKENNNEIKKLHDESENLKKQIKKTIYEKKTLEKELKDVNKNNNNNFKLHLIRKHNLIYKNTNDDLNSIYYFGWKEVINNFIM